MGSIGQVAYLAWSEHWPEVMKVKMFSEKYVEEMLRGERRLTDALIHAMERLAERNGVEKPRFGLMFPLKYVDWTYATPCETYLTDIKAVDWDNSLCDMQDNPDFLHLARRIEYVQKKYRRRYFSVFNGCGRISARWVYDDFQWLGKGRDFGIIMNGRHFDEEAENIDLFDVISGGSNHYYPQDWERVRQNAAKFISEYGSPDAAPPSLRHVLEVADTVLATGQPENFRIGHSY